MLAFAADMHMDISPEQVYARIVTGKKAAPQNLGLPCVRAFAAEMHMDISQEQSFARIVTGKT